jgi:restriction system protein
MGAEHADGKGFFITTNIFTLQAEQWAEDKPIEVIDGTRLVQLVRESGVIGNQAKIQAVTQTESETTKLCPQCGSPLVKRTNRESGKQFLGCSRYPDCTFTK